MTVIIGAVGTCIGGWIKVMGVSPDRFYVALIGQSIIAVSQVFILGVPPNVAAVWFGPQQVSSACAIGVFGNQVRILFLLLLLLLLLHLVSPVQIRAEIVLARLIGGALCKYSSRLIICSRSVKQTLVRPSDRCT